MTNLSWYEPPELGYCPDCDTDSLMVWQASYGVEAGKECQNDECPTNNEDD